LRFSEQGKSQINTEKKSSVLKYLQLQLGFVFFLNSLNQTTEEADGGKTPSFAKS